MASGVTEESGNLPITARSNLLSGENLWHDSMVT